MTMIVFRYLLGHGPRTGTFEDVEDMELYRILDLGRDECSGMGARVLNASYWAFLVRLY